MKPLHQSLALLAACSALVVASGEAQAQKIVKWVDAQGVTHYGEKAPEGAQAAPVIVTDSASSDAESEIEKLNKRRAARASTASEDDDTTSGPATAKKEAPSGNDDEDRKRCEKHRQNLEMLKTGKRIRILEKDGKPRAIGDAERQAQISFAEDELKRCEQMDKIKSAREADKAAARPATK